MLLYCCPELQWVLPDKAYSPITTKYFSYPTELKDLLAGWRYFRTLDDVALDHRGLPTMSRLQQSVPGGDSFWSARVVPTIAKAAFAIAHRLYNALLSSDPILAHTKKLLVELAETGLLISDDQLLRICTNTSYEGVKTTKVSSLGLLKGDITSAAFDAHLETFLDHIREHGRELSVIVSGLEDFSDSDRRSLSALKRRYHCNLTYQDARDRHHIAQNLIRHGVPPDRAEFALFGLGRKGCNLGALRNGLLLQCPLQGLMICNLSSVCTPLWHPHADRRPTLRVTSKEVEAYRLFRPDDSLLQPSPKSDIIAAHEQGLGKLVPQLVADFHANGRVVFESACEHLLGSIWRRGGHVVATTNGTLSVLAHISPEFAGSILMGLDNRAPSGQFTGNSWRGKLLLNSADSYTLGHEPPVGEHCVCVDTSANLPPFVPVGEDDQQIFFLILFGCFPGSYVFSVPCGLPMKREPRDQSQCECEYFPRLRDLLIPCITSAELMGVDDVIMKRVGEGLQTLASLPAREFREQVRSAVKEHFERNAPRWQLPPSFRKRYASLLKRFDTLTDNRNQMMKGSQLFNVADVAAGSCIDDKATAVQETFMRFGDLLKSWTEILEISGQSCAPLSHNSNK